MVIFLDLQKINQQYAYDLKRAASEVIDSGWYLLGERVSRFEQNLSNYIGVKHAIGVANGLDALQLILRAYIEMGVMNEGDEIIVPANTYIATILAITDNRLTPILVEPDINTYNLDISLIEQHITERTRAIVVVHLYGRVCWSEELESIAHKYNLKTIEDNAQAIGAIWNGMRIGNNVFVGPNATFTNDLLPRSKEYPESFIETYIEDWVSVGANATILAGITIGRYAMIGAGSVVTKDVAPFNLWYGNPATHKGYVTREGKILSMNLIDKEGNKYTVENTEPIPLGL